MADGQRKGGSVMGTGWKAGAGGDAKEGGRKEGMKRKAYKGDV